MADEKVLETAEETAAETAETVQESVKENTADTAVTEEAVAAEETVTEEPAQQEPAKEEAPKAEEQDLEIVKTEDNSALELESEAPADTEEKPKKKKKSGKVARVFGNIFAVIALIGSPFVVGGIFGIFGLIFGCVSKKRSGKGWGIITVSSLSILIAVAMAVFIAVIGYQYILNYMSIDQIVF